MTTADLVTVVLPVLAVLALGFALGRSRKLETRPLTRVTFDVLIPCLVFEKLARLALPGGAVGAVALGAAATILGSLLLGALALRALRVRRPVLLLPIAIMNTANLPFPVLESAWGETGLGLGVVFYGVATLLAFTVGVVLASGRADVGFMLRTPAVLAILAGAAAGLSGIRLPEVALAPVVWLGRAAIPLVLLITGSELARVKTSDLRLSALGAGLRLGAGVAVGLVYVTVAGLDGLPRRVVLFDAAMPAAMMCTLLASRYDRDAPLVASTVLISTIVGVISVPVLLALLG